ncbi:unnamed protein product [Phaedon cochleariae]|uniref:Uncharacterized protein n=1 Tax=Phaedon cochleariae TaxID=80249 RepID=A0A9N9SDP9_PHACE|nr:unnamed protein product [Phaedon cochleariae]
MSDKRGISDGEKQMGRIYMLGEKHSGLKPRGPLQNYEKLKKHCIENGVLFEDSQFDPEKVRMAENIEQAKIKIEWLRPTEITNSPLFIGQNEDRFDVNQGTLGDCWFLAALANVTLNSELMQFIVPGDQSFDHDDYAGIFHFRFWQYGRWIDIVVDDKLPTYDGELIYVKAKDSNVFWTALLEKAYAKLYISYANIEGGLVSEALEDLTGGLSESYFELKKNNEAFNFFDMMQISFMKNSFMGCAILAGSGEIEKKRDDGLYAGHAYSITDIVEEKTMFGELYKLLRIRNPWGRGEWNGDWSDYSKMWDYLQDTKRQELLSRKEDGEFWMQFEQFIEDYTLLEFCHMDLDIYKRSQDVTTSWEKHLLEGAWVAQVSSGGLPDNEDFLKNPQYILSLNDEDTSKVHRLLIGLMQKNRRIQNNQPALTIGFAIFSLEEIPEKKQLLSQDSLKNRIFVSRIQCVKQITGHLDLSNGIYCIVPFAENSSSSCEFLLRIFSSVHIDFRENDEEVKLIEPDMSLERDHVDSSTLDNPIREIFKNHADEKNEEISWKELHSILQKSGTTFSREICRSMVALVDSDRSGTLNIHEFFHLWEQLLFWRGAFGTFDFDNSNCISASELREALRSVNIQVTNRIIDMLLIRFGNGEGGMEMQDFIHCCIKLNMMIENYSNYKGESSLEEWLLDTIYS